MNLPSHERATLETVCRELDPESQIITLFAENYTPLNCRSALEGVFHFAYQVSNRNLGDFLTTYRNKLIN